MSERKNKKSPFLILLDRLFLVAAAIGFSCVFAAAQLPPESSAPINVAPPVVSKKNIVLPMRVKLFLDETRTINLPYKVEKTVVLSPVIVNVSVVGENSIRVSCTQLGMTTIIIIGAGQRSPLIVEAVSHPSQSAKEFDFLARRTQNKFYGDYSVGFSPPFSQVPAVLRQTLSLRRKLSATKTLRADADFYTPLGKGDSAFAAFNSRFNLSRIELGLTEKDYLLDFLDSNINFSRSSLDNFLVRGIHYQKRDASLFGRTRRLLEVFGGLARPTVGFFDRRSGGLIGGIVPLVVNPDFVLRTGAVAVIDKKGTDAVLRIDSVYEQSERNRYELALDANGHGVSFYGRTENKLENFIFNTETTKVSASSPFIKIGAQGSARNSFNGSVYWNPQKIPVSGFISYERTKAFGFAFSRQNFSYNLEFFIASLNYARNARTRFGFSYIEQNFGIGDTSKNSADTSAAQTAVPFLFSSSTKTRSLTFTYGQLFGRGFTNEFSIRPTFGRDRRSKAPLDRGFTLQEELRRSWERFSVSGFTNITRRSTSPESSIISNPSLLPADLRAEFDRNPAQFFVTYRDVLPLLAGGLKLSPTGNFEAGIKTQGSFTKHSFVGDLRYVKSNFFAQQQSYILASVGYTYRLDEANLIGINASSLFSNDSNIGARGTVSANYTYRFGSGGEKNFNPLDVLGLKKLFGFGEGQIVGRVFRDSNGNATDDQESGLANVKITLDQGKIFTLTDADGNYNFKKVSYGSHQIAVKLDQSGISARLTTPEEQTVFIGRSSPQPVNFGFYDRGFIAGRVFNDARFDVSATGAEGLPNIRLNVTSIDLIDKDKPFAAAKMTDLDGRYDFYSLPPGKYALEIDSASLPPDFRLPEKTRWEISVVPLLGNYYDIPVFAQRAIAGTVFIDKDGDNIFDPQKDEPREGVRVTAQIKSANPANKSLTVETVSGKNGAYILRNLPAGAIDVQAVSTGGKASPTIGFSLEIEPVTKRGANLAVPR